MLRKTLEFSTPGTRLSISHRQLVAERPNLPVITRPIEDMGVVIVDDVRANYTQAVFLDLLAAGATVMICGRDHLPVGMVLPLDAHHIQTQRHRAQVEASQPTRKRVWQKLVETKIAQQAKILEYFTGTHRGLLPMARRVRSGDPENLEAQAAQRYWPALFGPTFLRDRESGGINALLNYGYAVMRAAVARAVVAAGLIPSLGVFHSNRSNPFCLADDLLEPYRAFVDWRVRLLVNEFGEGSIGLEDRTTRAALLSLLGETVVVEGRRIPIQLSIEVSATSLARALTGGEIALALPQGLPVAPDPFEGEELE